MRRRRGTKAAAIREYKKGHRAAKPTAIVEALAANGIKVTPQQVSTTLYHAKNKKGKRRGAAGGRAKGSIPSDYVIEAKKLVDEVGSIAKAKAALEVLAKLQ